MRWSLLLSLLISLYSNPASASAQSPTVAEDAAEVTWDEVRGVFQKRCFACHRGEQARGGLDLSTVAAIRAGSTSGAAVVPGKPEESLIYTLPAHLEDPRMPPNGSKLPQRELDLISRWIQGGMSEKIRDPDAPAANSPRPAAAKRKTASLRPGIPATEMRRTTAPAAAAAPETPQPDGPAPRFSPPVRHQHRTIAAIAASPVSALIAVPLHHEILLFDWTDQSLRQRIPFPWGDVFALRFSIDGSILIAGGGVGAESGRAAGFDVLTGEQLFVTSEEPDVVLAADLAPNGRWLAVGGPSRKLHVYDTTTSELAHEVTKHTDWILQLSFSNDSLLLASGDRFGSVLITETASGAEFAALRGHSGPISGLSWSADSSEIFSASHDGSVRIRELHGVTEKSLLQPQAGRILNAVFLPASGVVIGTADRKLSLLNTDGHVSPLAQLDDEVVRLAVTQDGTHVLAADAAGNLSFHNLENGQSMPLPPFLAAHPN